MEPIAFFESGNTVFLHHIMTTGVKITEGVHMTVVRGGKALSWRPFDDTAALISTANI